MTTIEIEIMRATDELKKLIKRATEFSDKELGATTPNKKSAVRRESFDLDEAYDDIPGKDAVRCIREKKILVGLHEIAGLVNRARAELAGCDVKGCAITLGRIASAIDCELNK